MNKDEPRIYNRTALPIEEIERKLCVGRIKHNWRECWIDLYPGETSGFLYMVGRSFDDQNIVVTHEPIGLNEQTAMDYWRHGEKTLVRD